MISIIAELMKFHEVELGYVKLNLIPTEVRGKRKEKG